MGGVAMLVAACCMISVAMMMRGEATTIRMHNDCGSSVCFKYWVPGKGAGACSDSGTWSVSADSSWAAATMWAITGTGCGGQACNTGPPSGVTQFEITVAGGGGNDYYDVSKIAGYNVGMKAVPTNGNCPVAQCTTANSGPCYYPGGPDETKACTTGTTDYDVYVC